MTENQIHGKRVEPSKCYRLSEKGIDPFCEDWSFQKTCHRLGFTEWVRLRYVSRKGKAVSDRESGGNKLWEPGGPEKWVGNGAVTRLANVKNGTWEQIE